MEVLAFYDTVFGGLFESFNAVTSYPSPRDLLIRCPLPELKHYQITQIEKVHCTTIVVHLVHYAADDFEFHCDYVIPPHYACVVTDEDVREIQSGRSIFTLRRLFVRTPRAHLRQK